MTELEELRLRISRAKRLIADIRDDIQSCRRDVKAGLTEDAEIFLNEMLVRIVTALGGDE